MFNKISAIFGLSFIAYASHALAGNFAWGRTNSGAEFCFPADENGHVYPRIDAVEDFRCGGTFAFGRATDRSTYCFPAKGDGTVLKGRDIVDNIHLCAYGYEWSSATNGETLCFPKGRDGKVPPRVAYVDRHYCF